MSDDTANPSNTPNENTEPTPAEGQSRRAVLKAAVIGSAAVAAVAGAGTAGLALAGKKVPFTRLIGQVQISGQEPCSACVTGSASNCNEDFPQLGCIDPPTNCAHPQFTIVPQGGGKAGSNPGSFFVWVTVKNVPANDSISITFTLPVGFTVANGNSYFLYTSPAGTASTCPLATDPNCSNSSPTGSTFIKNASSLAGLFPYAVGGSSVDVQLMVHCDYSGGQIGQGNSQNFTFSFTATETPVGGGPTEVCDDSFTITGVQTAPNNP
jgi:hypothetical protein